jgi:hypothetical protein
MVPPPVSDNDALAPEDSGNGVRPDTASHRLDPPPTNVSLAAAFALKEERARREQLEAQLDALRSSESFRIGHALVAIGHGRVFRKRSKAPQPDSGTQGLSPPPPNLPEGFALREERVRRQQLEAELDALRSSLSFRIGHALVMSRGLLLLAFRKRSARSLLVRTKRLLRRLLGPSAPRRKVLIVALDNSNGLAEEVEALQSMLVQLEPILLADLGTAGDRGGPELTAEHLIPFEQWRVHRPPLEWGRYVAARITSIVDEHAPDMVVLLGSHEHRRLANLTAVLAPTVLSGIARSESNVV